jgi:hypothetical protein
MECGDPAPLCYIDTMFANLEVVKTAVTKRRRVAALQGAVLSAKEPQSYEYMET